MTDNTTEEIAAWARDRLKMKSAPELEPVAGDAGTRRYFRLRDGKTSRIIMDASDETGLGVFAKVASRLVDAGIHAPEILATDPDRGLMLLEDLGEQSYLDVLDEDTAEDLFRDAIDCLIAMQQKVSLEGLNEYDPALLLEELSLFPDWFLASHWQVEPTEDELDAWEFITMTLVRWARDQEQVFVHRDFMPRNLIVSNPNPGVIDFQDAVAGPISYDPICLYRDAFVSWPEERVDEWLEDYRQRALAAGLPVTASPELWLRTCDFMGTQRHLKVLGIFARLCYRDGKPSYVKDAPRFFRYLARAVGRNPELGELGKLLAAWKKRRTTGG